MKKITPVAALATNRRSSFLRKPALIICPAIFKIVISHVDTGEFLLAVLDDSDQAPVSLPDRGETNLIPAALYLLRFLVAVEEILAAAAHASHFILTLVLALRNGFVDWLPGASNSSRWGFLGSLSRHSR